MGITFDRTTRIAGYRPAIFKAALRGFCRTSHAGCMIDLKSVFENRRDGAIVYEECLDRGFIDPESGEVTDNGLVVARAKVVARAPIAKARAVLDDFLDRVDHLNHDPEAVSRVNQVWLFGSTVRNEESVGDVDLALIRSAVPRFADDFDGQVEQAQRCLSRIPDAPQYWTYPWEGIDWLYLRSLFGRRRHPLLSGVQEGVEVLIAMGVPCQLVYDLARGGRVDDPVLRRHPSSAGRSNAMPPLPQFPDLAAKALRPMDARWLCGFSETGEVNPIAALRDRCDERHRLFPRRVRDLRIAADGDKLRMCPWLPKSVCVGGLDGRNAVAVFETAHEWGTCITLHREICTEPDGHLLRASFSDLQLHKARKHPELFTLPDITASIALIVAADAERILRRQIEMEIGPKVRIEICSDGLDGEMKRFLAAQVFHLLQQRYVSIEPAELPAVIEVVLC